MFFLALLFSYYYRIHNSIVIFHAQKMMIIVPYKQNAIFIIHHSLLEMVPSRSPITRAPQSCEGLDILVGFVVLRPFVQVQVHHFEVDGLRLPFLDDVDEPI